jgi:hypothetical protein
VNGKPRESMRVSMAVLLESLDRKIIGDQH